MTTISLRPCRICGKVGNKVVASERPSALWGDRPWMPEGHYTIIRCRVCCDLYVDSDVTEAYLDNLQGSVRPEFEKRTTYEAAEDMEKIRTLELAENWEMIKRIRRPSPNDKLLDYGSAWGAFGNIAKEAGVIPNGIELQAAGATHSLGIWGGESVIHQGPIETAPFGENTFEYVTSFETLEHVYDPIRILSNMKRLVKEGGVIAISVPLADYFSFKYWLYRKQPFNAWMRRKYPGNTQEGRVLIHNHLNTFSVGSARLVMEKAGLRVIYISPWGAGLRGGRLGKVLRLVGNILWIVSFKTIAFAPSIFVVGNKKVDNRSHGVDLKKAG